MGLARQLFCSSHLILLSLSLCISPLLFEWSHSVLHHSLFLSRGFRPLQTCCFLSPKPVTPADSLCQHGPRRRLLPGSVLFSAQCHSNACVTNASLTCLAPSSPMHLHHTPRLPSSRHHWLPCCHNQGHCSFHTLPDFSAALDRAQPPS